MSSAPRKYTTAELEALPVGTIFSAYDQDFTVWVKDTASTAQLISHEGAMPEGEGVALNIFAVDEPTNTGISVVDITVVGFDPSRIQHTHGNGKMRIYYNRSLTMSPGKLAAHAVHAALTALGVHHGLPVVVLQAGPQKIEAMRTHIYDAGHTELAPGTLTTGTEWPLDSEER